MPLYRSNHGEIACADHAPLTDLRRWRSEEWQRVLPTAIRDDLQCQQCWSSDSRTSEGPVARKPLVLNVDDRKPSLYAREHLLRQHGYVVVNATTAAETVATVRRLRPSLVLLDVHLPDADGRDVCRMLKHDGELGSIPVVLISATLGGHVNSLEAVRWAQCDAYLSEPVDPAVLEATLRAVLLRVT